MAKQFKILSENIIPIIYIKLVVLFFISSLYAQSDTIETNVPALKNVFKKDFYIGCLLSYRHIGFPTDPYVSGQSAVVAPNGGYLIIYHMNSMSPGNNMKPQYTVDINASASAYLAATDKDYADTHPIVKFNGDLIAQLNWAKRQGFTFRGHTLIWHSQTPAEFFRSGYNINGPRLSKEKMIQRMENYIKEVIRLLHEDWPGLLTAMDVVNEAVNDNGGDRTESEWYQTFGDNSYIMKAFELTRKYTIEYGETQIKLYYNDYNTHFPAKADGIVKICKPIFEAGYLDGIGMQEHDDLNSPTASQWISTYNKFYPICNEMAITELDVATGYANPPASILQKQANQYAQLFKCFVERSYFSGRGKIISVSKDGLNDQYTFKTNQSSSLWDSKNKCKPAFYAVVSVGMNYNAIDSLLSVVNTLKESEYTTDSWLKLNTALTNAKNIMNKNYTNSESAADSLYKAKLDLENAISNLVPISTDVTEESNIIKNYFLSQNYPNPFNPSTIISYQLPERNLVTIKVYDILGREVATLINEYKEADTYKVEFSADEYKLSSGIYFYTLSAGKNFIVRKMMLAK